MNGFLNDSRNELVLILYIYIYIHIIRMNKIMKYVNKKMNKIINRNSILQIDFVFVVKYRLTKMNYNFIFLRLEITITMRIIIPVPI